MADFKSLCRVCLRPASVSLDSVRRIEGDKYTVEQLLDKYTNVQYKERWLPRSLCVHCVRHLENSHKFHRKYKRSRCELAQRYTEAHPVLTHDYLHGKNPNEIKILPKTLHIIQNSMIKTSDDVIKSPQADVTQMSFKSILKQSKSSVTESSLTLKEVLVNHNELFHLSRRKKCGICNEMFASVELLEKHKSTHSDALEYGEIRRTDLNSSSQRTLSKDEEWLEGLEELLDEPQLGSDCEYVCEEADGVIEKLVRCRLCSSTFKSHTRYLQHRAVHAGGMSCWSCNSCWPDRAQLAAHAITHDGFLCARCHLPYASRTALMVHYKKRHGLTQIPYFCGICNDANLAYSDISDLQEHMNTHSNKTNDKDDRTGVKLELDKKINTEYDKTNIKSCVNEVGNDEGDNTGRKQNETKHTVIELSLQEAVELFDMQDLRDKSFVLKVKDNIENDKINIKKTDGADIKESTQKEICDFELLAEFTDDKFIVNNFEFKEDEECQVDLEDKIHNLEDVDAEDMSESNQTLEEEQKTEQVQAIEEDDTATVHYYVVDNDNAENLIEITAEQAQQLVCGETLEAKSDDQEPVVLEEVAIPLPSHECRICGVKVTRKYNLQRHLAVAHGMHTLLCRQCGMRFNNPSVFDVHRMKECTAGRKKCKEKSKIKPRQSVCPMCEKRFETRPQYLDHMRATHGNSVTVHGGERYLCRICDKLLTTRAGFDYHMRRHSGVPGMHRCELCPRRFTTRAALHNHTAGKHLQRRPHLCPSCGRGFVSTDHLRKHLRLTHGGRRDFLCIECGHSFQQASHLAQHQWVHTGIKPHVCRYCEGRYSCKTSLKKHMTRQHAAEYARDLALEEEKTKAFDR